MNRGNRRYNVSLLILFLLSPTAGSAADNPHIKFLGIEQGLSNNAVTSIYQDEKGFMWFGTYDGLNRYDVYGFGRGLRNGAGCAAPLSLCTIRAKLGEGWTYFQ